MIERARLNTPIVRERLPSKRPLAKGVTVHEHGVGAKRPGVITQHGQQQSIVKWSNGIEQCHNNSNLYAID